MPTADDFCIASFSTFQRLLWLSLILLLTKMSITNFYNKKDPTGLWYQHSALFLCAGFSVLSALLKISKNIGAKSTLKFNHFTNARAAERRFLTINMPKPIQNQKYIKGNPLQLNTWSLRMRSL